jgi:hypothetical protein
LSSLYFRFYSLLASSSSSLSSLLSLSFSS